MSVSFLSGPLAQSIGWALLHLIWQGAIVAAALAAALALLAQRSANARYVTACVALALLPVLAVATAFRAYESPAPAAFPAVQILHADSLTLDVARAAATEATRSAVQSIGQQAQRALPDVVLLWLIGVTMLSIRLVISWSRVRELAHSSPAASAEWERVLGQLSTALGLDRAVALLESAAVEVPTVIGWLRPVIVLPASTLAGLSGEQIEMLLGHELAHIRRHDFLVNLMQSFVETVMFYHPAVWWMSRRIRIERENCCDDLAVDVCGSPVKYARALTRLEELRSRRIGLAVAANGGSLMGRIRRLVAPGPDATAETPRWIAAAAALAIVIALLTIPTAPALAEREASAKPAKKAAPAKPAQTEPAVLVSPRNSEPDDVDDIEVPEPPEVPDLPEPPETADAPEPPSITVNVAAPDDDILLAPPAPMITPMIRPMVAVAPMVAAAVVNALDEPLALPAPVIAPMPPAAPRTVPAPAPLPRPLRFRERDASAQMRAHHFRHIADDGKLTVDDLIALRASGVTPEYIRQMKAAGLGDVSLDDVLAMRVMGVTPAFLQEMRGAGAAVNNVATAIQLRAVGVTAAYVAELAAAGYRNLAVSDLVALRNQGVTASLVHSLAAAGYSNLSVRDLMRLAAVGINGPFIEDLARYRTRK